MAATTQRDWLVAIRAPCLGGARLIHLVESLGGIHSLVAADRATLAQAGIDSKAISALKNPDLSRIDSDREWLEGEQRYLLACDDERFPALLKSTPSPPAALFVEGDLDLLWQPQLAVIGSRNPTAGGVENARDFTTELSRQGLTITSGMASGIDSVAHQAALDAGGRTVAVAGTGPDQVYPASNREIAARIRERGVLVSEFPPGTPPLRGNFPARNRIISGLSLGVLVIEAGLNSGTLITARLAGEQGREVFALPGSIHNPMSKGCHRLIREGAKLVENAAEIMQELAPMAGRLAGELKSQLAARDQDPPGRDIEIDAWDPQLAQDPDYVRLWRSLGYDPIPVDRIIERSGLTARAVSAMLLVLELRGMVEAHRGGAWSRKRRGKK
jgi:DNA processing protein